MKTLVRSVLVTALLLGIASCNNEDQLTEEALRETPLRTYTLTSDENGAITIEHSIPEVTSEINSQEISDATIENLAQRGFFPFFNNEVEINFIGSDNTKRNIISIFNNIVDKLNEDRNLVRDYSIELQDNGTYQFNFKLVKNIVPTFQFNEETNTNEILLDKGITGRKNNYSINYEKAADEKLHIMFFRAVEESSAKAKDDSGKNYLPEPPEVIVQ